MSEQQAGIPDRRENFMKCELMHRKISAAEIEIDSDSGSITRILNVSAPEHLPIGVTDQKGNLIFPTSIGSDQRERTFHGKKSIFSIILFRRISEIFCLK